MQGSTAVTKRDNWDDVFDLKEEDMMIIIFGTFMMVTFMQMMNTSLRVNQYVQDITSEGQSEGHRLTATTVVQSVQFSTPMQSVSVTNDGSSYIYLYINSLDARPIEVRPRETITIAFDTHSIAALYYCTRGGDSEFRIRGIY